MYRFVIGPGGAQINSIRKQTGCRITVPKDQAKGEAIEVLGSKEGVEKAKDIILGIVKNGGSGGGGGGSRRQS
jgi:rRNA processing protein Krr1/Pno1